MTVKELNELYENTKLEENEKLAKDKKLYQEGERSINKYNRSSLLLERKSSNTISDYEYLDELMEYLYEYKQSIGKFENEIGFNVSLDFNIHDENISDNEFVAYYYILKEEVSDITINHMFKDKVSKILKPSISNRIIPIDCKLLQLFKDGAIDWSTLQKLTYSDCNL